MTKQEYDKEQEKLLEKQLSDKDYKTPPSESIPQVTSPLTPSPCPSPSPTEEISES